MGHQGHRFTPIDLETLRAAQATFAEDRDWQKFHTPRNLLLAFIGEAGELSECFQWKGEVERGLPSFTPAEREHVAQEISDCLLYLIRLADVCGVDLGTAVMHKMQANATKYPADRCRGSSAKYTTYTHTHTHSNSETHLPHKPPPDSHSPPTQPGGPLKAAWQEVVAAQAAASAGPGSAAAAAAGAATAPGAMVGMTAARSASQIAGRGAGDSPADIAEATTPPHMGLRASHDDCTPTRSPLDQESMGSGAMVEVGRDLVTMRLSGGSTGGAGPAFMVPPPNGGHWVAGGVGHDAGQWSGGQRNDMGRYGAPPGTPWPQSGNQGNDLGRPNGPWPLSGGIGNESGRMGSGQWPMANGMGHESGRMGSGGPRCSGDGGGNSDERGRSHPDDGPEDAQKRKRFTDEQKRLLLSIAEASGWSLTGVSMADRDRLQEVHGISKDRLQNFLNNRKPRDFKARRGGGHGSSPSRLDANGYLTHTSSPPLASSPMSNYAPPGSVTLDVAPFSSMAGVPMAAMGHGDMQGPYAGSGLGPAVFDPSQQRGNGPGPTIYDPQQQHQQQRGMGPGGSFDQQQQQQAQRMSGTGQGMGQQQPPPTFSSPPARSVVRLNMASPTQQNPNGGGGGPNADSNGGGGGLADPGSGGSRHQPPSPHGGGGSQHGVPVPRGEVYMNTDRPSGLPPGAVLVHMSMNGDGSGGMGEEYGEDRGGGQGGGERPRAVYAIPVSDLAGMRNGNGGGATYQQVAMAGGDGQGMGNVAYVQDGGATYQQGSMNGQPMFIMMAPQGSGTATFPGGPMSMG